MAEIYTTQETGREIERMRFGPVLHAFNGAAVILTHQDALGPDGKLSATQIHKTLEDFGNDVQSVASRSDSIFRELRDNDLYQISAFAGPNLKTTDGQDICLIAGNLTYQTPKEAFSSLAYMKPMDVKFMNVPGDSRSWAALSALHEIGHCANKDTENRTPPLQKEIQADRYALAQYQILAADPSQKLDPAVPQAYMDARILGGAFTGFHPDENKDMGIIATTLLHKTPEEHDTYLGVVLGMSPEDSAAASSRANTLIYSMAPQTEKIRLGGAEAFSRKHPELEQYSRASHPGQALDQAGQLMAVQEDLDLLKDPKEMAQTQKAVSNASIGALLVYKDRSLAYATSQAVLDNGMVPKGSPEETYIRDYMSAIERYRPQDANKDLGAEVSANFNNTVSRDAIARSNAAHFPAQAPAPDARPDTTPQPDPDRYPMPQDPYSLRTYP